MPGSKVTGQFREMSSRCSSPLKDWDITMISNNNLTRIIAVIALMCLMPREGHMSQSFLEFTSLENLVNGSAWLPTI